VEQGCEFSSTPLRSSPITKWREQNAAGKISVVSSSSFENVITILDEWVMREAIKWLLGAPNSCYCNVNVSALSSLNTEWVARVIELLRTQAKPLGRLRLEITETALLSCATAIATTLDQLVDAGAQIFLDDFGTGFSSLSHLQRFPIEGIKVDRSFVTRLYSSARDRRIVSAMVGLANDLGLSLTAEGVKTEAQRTCLMEIWLRTSAGLPFRAARCCRGSARRNHETTHRRSSKMFDSDSLSGELAGQAFEQPVLMRRSRQRIGFWALCNAIFCLFSVQNLADLAWH